MTLKRSLVTFDGKDPPDQICKGLYKRQNNLREKAYMGVHEIPAGCGAVRKRRLLFLLG